MRIALLIALAAIAVPARADTVYVRAGKLIDPARASVEAGRLIRIVDGRIAAVTPDTGVPRGAQVVDWRDKTVLPGLIDMHTHVADGVGTEAEPTAVLGRSAAETVLRGAGAARTTLRAGFTTVRDVGVYRGLTDVALRDAIARGDVEGPRMFVSGAYLTVPGGGGDVTGISPDVGVPPDFRLGVVRGAEDARDKARFLLQHGADQLKMIAGGAVLALGGEVGQQELSDAEMQAICAEAAAGGRFCIAHAHGPKPIKAAIRNGARTIEHASLIDDEGIALAKTAGVWLSMDIYNGDFIDSVGRKEGWPADYIRKNLETTEKQREGFQKAVKAGVKIVFGTDAGVYPHGDNARQFAYMVRYGMTPMQAIQAATTEAADALGQRGKVGSLAPGAYGDLIAVDGDPLGDIRILERVSGVVKGGALIR